MKRVFILLTFAVCMAAFNSPGRAALVINEIM